MDFALYLARVQAPLPAKINAQDSHASQIYCCRKHYQLHVHVFILMHPFSFRTCRSCCRANRRWSISSRPRTASTTGCARARPHLSPSTRNRYGLIHIVKTDCRSLVWFDFFFLQNICSNFFKSLIQKGF